MLARSGVILLVEVKVSVHKELNRLENLNIKVLFMLDQLVVLYADVDLRQFFLVAIVKVSHLNPTVH